VHVATIIVVCGIWRFYKKQKMRGDIMRLLKKFIRLNTLQSKISISFILLLIIPFSIFSFLMSKPIEKIMEERISDSIQNSLNIKAITLESIFREMMRSVTIIALDRNVADILSFPEKYNNYERGRTIINLMDTDSLYLNKIEKHITVMDFHDNIYTSWRQYRTNEYELISSMDWYGRILETKGRFAWVFHDYDYITKTEDNLLTIAALVDRYGKAYGAAMVSIYEDDIYKIISDKNEDESSETAIINEEAGIVSFTNSEMPKESLREQDFYKRVFENDEGYFIDFVNEQKTIVNYAKVGNTDWKLIIFTPYDSIFKQINDIRKNTAIFIALMLLIFTAITVLISFTITGPIKMLRNNMRKVKEDDLGQMMPVQGSDEVKDLIVEYNKMTRRIKTLFENVKEEQKQKQELRFKALQAQINPHFILNTLNNIKFVAIMSRANEAAKMITALGSIMEDCIGKGEDIINLGQEIKYIENYVYLQKIRYNDKFSVFYDIDEEVLNCRVFKFILQPIVENSIYHGIQNIEGTGRIDISAHKEGDNLVIKVKDNGAGIQPERLKAIREYLYKGTEPEKKGRVGIKNIHDRIVLSYGEEYGLKIDSIEGKETEVTVVIPWNT
jgi:two-component system sensor histidine kinase YesM